MITRKICLLGAFAAGKTSLMRRFVHGVFVEKYTTTLGVKIDTKVVDLDEETIKLIIWDIEGADPADQEVQLVNSRMQAYLTGMDGLLLVADGTRKSTIGISRQIHNWISREYAAVPIILLLNKSDLTEEWQFDDQSLEGFEGLLQSFTTSALSGENVERTFKYLAETIVQGR